MSLTFLYRAFCRVLQLIRLSCRTDKDLAIEGRHAAPPGRGPPTPGLPTDAAAGRPSAARGAGSPSPPASVSDGSSSSPPPCCAGTVTSSPSAGPTRTHVLADRPSPQEPHCARPPTGEGEPAMGLPAHPPRARHAGHPNRCFERLGDLEALASNRLPGRQDRPGSSSSERRRRA